MHSSHLERIRSRLNVADSRKIFGPAFDLERIHVADVRVSILVPVQASPQRVTANSGQGQLVLVRQQRKLACRTF